jgi:acyl carrier protein
MLEAQVKSTLHGILEDICKVKVPPLEDNQHLIRDFNLDSIEIVKLQVLVSNHFNLEIPSMTEEEWEEVLYVKGAVKLIIDSQVDSL